MQEPPGGPPDFDPPFIVSVTPDSGAVVASLDDALEIEFNEVIDERSGSGLENLVVLSPRPEETEVSWKRSRITVEPEDGWRDSVIYHLKLLPGVADLRNNRLDSGRTIVFSTGGAIPDTRIAGTVLNWEEGQPASRALIEAILLPDSLVYLTASDSVGDFELRHLTPGTYLVFGTVDQNNNSQRDYREVFDSTTMQLDSLTSHVFWAFAHDTVGPRISEVSDIDSVTIRVDFAQKLVPREPHDSMVRVYELPDTTMVEVVAVWNQTEYDSVSFVEAVEDSIRRAAIADSVAAAEAAADTSEAQPADVADTTITPADTVASPAVDSAAVDEVVAADSAAEELLQVSDSTDLAVQDSVAADTSRATLLLQERPALSASLFVRLGSIMMPGARYFISAVAENVSGAIAESQGLLILPEPVDTTEVPADTT